ncbi:FtsX-like permease family protein [Paenibacillus urinalis]|uniref:FtsX-like permease family protein n=2 Tax=Paenibacillus TaxID=44249 RepID=A0AAX3MTX1_9BACL|nr:FtsX-like permease family protein [Paenibacillus urinalis]WDH80498.1 FtsX-like permease family protein [Paenibacillus urinalis]WDH96539.1 FtsX-like permease family protein [Paenibacillus urinalis]WDI00185.1 FtsX-like permease family protein [Paenibacillus urinalis]
MTLFDLARKNIQGNFRSYFVYFFSMFVSTVIFYIFVSLQNSTEIIRSIESSESMKSIFFIASIVLILFVSVFILYSNQFFTRKRKQEVGLYALLGLPNQTIGKLLFYENLLIGTIVLVLAVMVGTLLSKLFSMMLARLLGVNVDISISISFPAVASTVIVFMIIILITSLQAYRLIYRFRLIELFRAEQEGESESRASIISACAAVLILSISYEIGLREFTNTEQILTNLGMMTVGIILGTGLMFSSFVIFMLRLMKGRKQHYFKGMNLVITSNLVYRMRGNARTFTIISILSALALCAFSFGLSTYHTYEHSARLAAPFSYMFVSQDEAFNKQVDDIIKRDAEHPVTAQVEISVVQLNGYSSNNEIISNKQLANNEQPIKVISMSGYNQAAEALGIPQVNVTESDQAIAIRPMFTEHEWADYDYETISLQLSSQQLTLAYTDMTIERIVNWSYPDNMIVVADELYKFVERQSTPVNYIGYAVEEQKTTKKTSDTLADIATPESKMSSYYAEYRVGIENAGLNVFILGFLGLVFLLALGSVLYFKQLTEATGDISRYDILKKIGVSNKEIRTSIIKQNAVVFMLPLLVGIVHYVVIFTWMRRLFGGLGGISLLEPILICISIFLVIYMFYFILTIGSVSKLLIGEALHSSRLALLGIVAGILILVGFLVWLAPEPLKEAEDRGTSDVHFDLPKPKGNYVIGVTELHLVDTERIDPWVNQLQRELMISIWYPAEKESEQRAAYMHEGAAMHYDEEEIPSIGLDPGTIDLSGIDTHAWLDAPAVAKKGGWPVIFFSPGGTVPRSFGTILVQELASQGYVVITIDHTHESSVVEFPDGRIVKGTLPEINAETVLKMIEVRVDDVRFALDQLEEMRTGSNIDAEQKGLPQGLPETLDLSKVGIYGHSAGGATAAQTMYEDDRFDAGIDMDGTLGHMPNHPLPVAQHGLDRPFMLLNSGINDEGKVDSHLTAEDRGMFWSRTSGWKFDLSIPNGAHFTFTDYQYLLPQIAMKLSLSRQVIHQSIGPVDPQRALDAQREYVSAFFDYHLKSISQPLLESSNSSYAEVKIIK